MIQQLFDKDFFTMLLMFNQQFMIKGIIYFLEIVFFFYLFIFGYRSYVICNSDTQRIILSKIVYSTKLDENNKPLGYFINNYCIGYLNEESRTLYCICTEKNFKSLTLQPGIYDEKECNKLVNGIDNDNFITIYYKNIQIEYTYYKSRILYVSHFSCYKNQQTVMNRIIKKYQDSKIKSIVTLLYGKPNSGKSMISLLIAKHFKSGYCKTYKPSEPGDSIDTLYNTCNPTVNKPLVILLDEVDIILDKVHNRSILPHNKVLTEVTDKISWNQLFDNISIGFYPYTIFILTSNKTPGEINKKYDPSYIRENRCHMIIEMKKDDL